MFELIFGLIWTAFTSLFLFLMYGIPSMNYTVNGNSVTREEFHSMLGPKLFIGMFLGIGIFLIIHGARKVIRNMQTKVNGEECFGRVLAIAKTGTYINERPVYKAQVLLISNVEGTDYTIWEEIGFNPRRFQIGEYIKVLYYKGDINFIDEEEYSTQYDIPEDTKRYLNDLSQDLIPTSNDDSILIDGVRYIREDSINNNKDW